MHSKYLRLAFLTTLLLSLLSFIPTFAVGSEYLGIWYFNSFKSSETELDYKDNVNHMAGYTTFYIDIKDDGTFDIYHGAGQDSHKWAADSEGLRLSILGDTYTGTIQKNGLLHLKTKDGMLVFSRVEVQPAWKYYLTQAFSPEDFFGTWKLALIKSGEHLLYDYEINVYGRILREIPDDEFPIMSYIVIDDKQVTTLTTGVSSSTFNYTFSDGLLLSALKVNNYLIARIPYYLEDKKDMLEKDKDKQMEVALALNEGNYLTMRFGNDWDTVYYYTPITEEERANLFPIG